MMPQQSIAGLTMEDILESFPAWMRSEKFQRVFDYHSFKIGGDVAFAASLLSLWNRNNCIFSVNADRLMPKALYISFVNKI